MNAIRGNLLFLRHHTFFALALCFGQSYAIPNRLGGITMTLTGKLLIATAAVAAFSGSAMAADLYVPPARLPLRSLPRPTGMAPTSAPRSAMVGALPMPLPWAARR